jgi:hypothetical protein
MVSRTVEREAPRPESEGGPPPIGHAACSTGALRTEAKKNPETCSPSAVLASEATAGVFFSGR